MKNNKRLINIVIRDLIFLLLVLPCVVFASAVPDTGQTKCHDDIGNQLIPCPEPGEPFYGQDAQYKCNPQSYTKIDENGIDLPDDASSWAMVRDNVTGLIWENKSEDNKDDQYDWPDALEYCESLTLGGYDDWRLPTIKELTLIRNMDTDNPAINKIYFPNMMPWYYWSSTSYADTSYYSAWAGHFLYGNVYWPAKSLLSHVRAVSYNQKLCLGG